MPLLWGKSIRLGSGTIISKDLDVNSAYRNQNIFKNPLSIKERARFRKLRQCLYLGDLLNFRKHLEDHLEAL